VATAKRAPGKRDSADASKQASTKRDVGGQSKSQAGVARYYDAVDKGMAKGGYKSGPRTPGDRGPRGNYVPTSKGASAAANRAKKK
jgi:hypothetical protein